MSNQDSNKEFISQAKKLLKEKGYDVKTSHLYDIFAKLSGYKDWHVASSKDVRLANSIKKYVNEVVSEQPTDKYLELINDFFLNQKNEKIKFDLFNPALPFWNYSISGQTGSGKTVLLKKMLTNVVKQYENKSLITIFDMGGEEGCYSKFISLFGGRTNSLTRASRPNIQLFELCLEKAIPTPATITSIARGMVTAPVDSKEFTEAENNIRDYFDEIIRRKIYFDEKEKNEVFKSIFKQKMGIEFKALFNLKKGGCEPSAQQFDFIMKILEIMLSSDKTNLDTFEMYDYDEIRSLIRDTYRKTLDRFPNISDFYNLLSNGEEGRSASELNNPKSKKLINKLKKWTSNGECPYFDKETTLDLTKNILLFDFKSLEIDPQLQIIYYLMINKAVNLKMEKSLGIKVVVRDEITTLLRYPIYGNSLLEDLKNSRQNGVANIIASQLILDYLHYNKELGLEIIKNFSCNIVGKLMSEKIINDIGQVLYLNSEDIEKIRNLGVHNDRFENQKESRSVSFFFSYLNLTEVYKNFLNPFESIFYSNNFEDNKIIDYYLNENKSLATLSAVLEFISEQKHLGDVELANYLIQQNCFQMARIIRGV